jgi:hypothetical protein
VELDWSGGDREAAFALVDAPVAVGSVAVADVVGERVLEGVPVEVVGVVTTNSVIGRKCASMRLR